MDKQIITFSANEQNLVRIGGEYHYSSNKVSYIGAHFDLGANWDGFDSVRAVWFTDRINGISTVLDGEGNCTVPTEVLKKKDRVFVNLVGSIVSNGELADRLTTYPAVALVVDSKAKVDSTETAPVTPSQFEQFVSIVQDAVANIKDIVSTTLNADYTLTFVYSDGTSYTTPSIRGERGPRGADGADGTDGNGIASAVLNSNYTLTLTFTDGTSYTTPSIRGAQGPKGDPGDVSQAQLDAAVSDLKSDISLLSAQDENGVYTVYPLGFLTFANTGDGRVKCTSEELQEGDIVYLTDPTNYKLALSTANGASLQGWYDSPIIMTSTRKYVAIKKADGSNIQSLPSGQFSRLVYVIRKARYYPDLVKTLSEENEDGNYIPYQIGELPFAITSDNRVKCSTIALNAGDVVHLRDTTNYRIGISQASGASPYGWFAEPVTITETRKYVIFKDANNANISSMLDFDVSKLIYVTRKSNYQKQIDGIKNSYKFAHISFDDVRYCMEDITTNSGTYISVFQNPFLAKLKEWHETYGAVFSLYLFSENMGNYTTAFASEFADNADWLKFGFHSVNANSNFENTTAAQAESAYSAFVDNIISIAGTVEAIDRLPRLGNFKGNLASMLAIRDCKCGVVGALSAYDTRDSYYLSSADSAYVKDHGKLYDATNYMTFFRTIMTMEVTNPSTSLPALLTKAEYNNSDYLIGMMHEYEIYTSGYALVSSMADRIEYACDWAVEHEYDWDFPMHKC